MQLKDFKVRITRDEYMGCICIQFEPISENGGFSVDELTIIKHILEKYNLAELMEYVYEYCGDLTIKELSNALKTEGITIL